MLVVKIRLVYRIQTQTGAEPALPRLSRGWRTWQVRAVSAAAPGSVERSGEDAATGGAGRCPNGHRSPSEEVQDADEAGRGVSLPSHSLWTVSRPARFPVPPRRQRRIPARRRRGGGGGTDGLMGVSTAFHISTEGESGCFKRPGTADAAADAAVLA